MLVTSSSPASPHVSTSPPPSIILYLPTVTPASFQDVCVRFSVIDQDRHCGPVEIGSTSVTLKVMIMFMIMFKMIMMMMMMVLVVMIYPQEAKQTGPAPDPDKFSSSQILSPPKKVKPSEISSPSKSHHHCAFSENMQRKVSIKSNHI